MNEKFIPTECGWVSPKTPPVNHNNVVVLLLIENNEIYHETIGYYADDEWSFRDLGYEIDTVVGWFPIPYTPHNH
jgi:hypothetical protein